MDIQFKVGDRVLIATYMDYNERLKWTEDITSEAFRFVVLEVLAIDGATLIVRTDTESIHGWEIEQHHISKYGIDKQHIGHRGWAVIVNMILDKMKTTNLKTNCLECSEVNDEVARAFFK